MTGTATVSARLTVVLTGAFGSGKTEVAISYCRAALAVWASVCLLDLDVVTPYFRVGDYRDQLQQEGIRVIAAPGGLASFELPALPPEIAGALASEDLHAVLDAGGDPVGARLLGVYAEPITARGYDMWLVVNPYRPDTSESASVAQQARAIEDSCGLRLTGIVANPNLGPLTRRADAERGLRVIEAAARELALPIVFLAVERSLVAACGDAGHALLPLTLIARPPWEHRGGED